MAPKTFIITPTYNEAKNLPLLVTQIAAQNIPDWHLIVIDDNSPDGTGQLADQLARQYPLTVIHRTGKLGFGSAYRQGFARALEMGAEQILQMDADLSHQPTDINRLLSALNQADVVIGSRYIKGGGNQNWAWWRQLISRSANLFAGHILGTKIHDVTSGFKAFSGEALHKIDFASSDANGYYFLVEINLMCLQAGLRVTEVPIIFVERTSGKSKLNMKIILESARRVLSAAIKR